MNNNFTYQTYLPVEQKYVQCTTFTGKTHLTLSKYIQNDDNRNVVRLFKEMIHTTCIDSIDINALATVDLFCLLLNMRIMSVSQTFDYEAVSQTQTERIKRTQKLDLYDILDKVTNFDDGYMSDIVVDDIYTITLSTPRSFKTSTAEDLILDVVDRLGVGDKTFNLCTLTNTEKTRILDELPGDAMIRIIDYIKKLDHKYRIRVFNTTDENLSEIELKLFDNSMFEFIKAMYNSNLQEQYYIRYIMVKRLGFRLNDVENISPIDTQNYINLYREELEEERKANEKNSGESKTSMALPTPEQ